MNSQQWGREKSQQAQQQGLKQMQTMQALARAKWLESTREMGGWLAAKKAQMDRQLLSHPVTRRFSLRSRIPLSLSDHLGPPSVQSEPTPLPKPQQLKPSATIRRMWPEHNVEYDDQTGMLIHMAFTISNLLERTGKVVAYFYFANGVPLKDFNSAYLTTTGNVCVARSFTPKYLNTVFDDFILFMPYPELHMGPGNHSLKFSASVWSDQNRELAWADGDPFTFTSG